MRLRRAKERRAEVEAANQAWAETGAAASTELAAPMDADGVLPLQAPDAAMVDVERALRLVRMAVAIIAIAAVVGGRAQGGALSGPAGAAAIFGGAALINLVTFLTHRKGWRGVTALTGQVLDVAGSLGLVLLLDASLKDSAWMIMLLPIVMGGVRFGASGTLLAWTLSASGYLAMVFFEVLVVDENKADGFGIALQRFAFLLALAVPVAALTQWLQQRWEHQRTLTLAADLRAHRLELIQDLARGFTGASEPRLLANLADAGVRLGFSTVTITLHSSDQSVTVAAVGQARRLPTDDVVVRPQPGETLVTHWGDAEDPDLTSVSILLDATGSAVAFHGWTEGIVDEDLARAFGLLGAHATVSLQAARMLADLHRQAKHDGLTGLVNRRAFDEVLHRAAGDRRPAALLLLDVDFFKQINDTYGHQAGDRVLRVIGERLRAAAGRAPGIDVTVARIGGDEFALLLVAAPLTAVADVADHIEASMATPIAVGGGADAVRVSFSIGIADTAGSWMPKELVAAADEATYEAKTHGRNRACWAPDAVGDGPLDPVDAQLRTERSVTNGGDAEVGRGDIRHEERDSLMTGAARPMDATP